MKKVKRFGISLEEDLLRELDSLVSKRSFPNRSQAIRSLIRNKRVEQDWNLDRNVAGCIVLVYDHHKRSLLDESIKLQHKYQSFILSVQHVHLDHSNCLEIIALKGRSSELKELSDKLIAIKGIKHGQLVMSGIG